MDKSEKIALVANLIGEPAIAPEKIEAYLTVAEKEILAWRYSYSKQSVLEVPAEYEMVQIHAVIAGLSISGAENQTQHIENGISRVFKYADMIQYIRSNVIPLAGVF